MPSPSSLPPNNEAIKKRSEAANKRVVDARAEQKMLQQEMQESQLDAHRSAMTQRDASSGATTSRNAGGPSFAPASQKQAVNEIMSIPSQRNAADEKKRMELALKQKDDRNWQNAKEIQTLREQVAKAEQYLAELKGQPAYYVKDPELSKLFRNSEFKRLGKDTISLYFPGTALRSIQGRISDMVIEELRKKGVYDIVLSSVRVRTFSDRGFLEISGDHVYINQIRDNLRDDPLCIGGSQGEVQARHAPWVMQRENGVTLVVGILKCTNLLDPQIVQTGQNFTEEELDHLTHMETFATVCIMGQPKSKLQTRTVEESRNPEYNFEGQLLNVVVSDVIKFVVYNDDTMMGDEANARVLGAFEMDVAKLVTPGATFEGKIPLKLAKGRPELHVKIIGPAKESEPGLDVWILSARNLPWQQEETQGPDPYCVVSIIGIGSKDQPRGALKTQVKVGNKSPIWGHQGRVLANQGDTIVFSVYHRDPDKRPEDDLLIGEAQIDAEQIFMKTFFDEMLLTGGCIDPKVRAKPILRVKISLPTVKQETIFPKPKTQQQIKDADRRWVEGRLPAVLWVKVPPRNDSYQDPISGMYVLVVRSYSSKPSKLMKVEGMPVWRQEGGPHFIYSGQSGHWFFGDNQERYQEFNCDTGVMCSVRPHNGAMPDEMFQRETGSWKMYFQRQWRDVASTSIVRKEPNKALTRNIWRACPELHDRLKQFCQGKDIRSHITEQFKRAVGENLDELEDYEFIYALRQQLLITPASISDDKLRDLFLVLMREERPYRGDQKKAKRLPFDTFLEYAEWTWTDDPPLQLPSLPTIPDVQMGRQCLRKALNFDSNAPVLGANEVPWTMPLPRYNWMQAEMHKINEVFDSLGRSGKLNSYEMVFLVRRKLAIPASEWPDDKINKFHSALLRYEKGKRDTDIDINSIVAAIDAELSLVPRELQRDLSFQVLDEGVFADPGKDFSPNLNYYSNAENASTFLQMNFLAVDAMINYVAGNFANASSDDDAASSPENSAPWMGIPTQTNRRKSGGEDAS